jgi:hypothetical protein
LLSWLVMAIPDMPEETVEVREDRENLTRIEESRASFQARLDELSRRTDKVRHAVDVRSRIREHPFAALGAAFGGGALLELAAHPKLRSAARPERGAIEALAFGLLAHVGQYLLAELTQHALEVALAKREQAEAEEAAEAADDGDDLEVEISVEP